MSAGPISSAFPSTRTGGAGVAEAESVASIRKSSTIGAPTSSRIGSPLSKAARGMSRRPEPARTTSAM